MAKKRSRRKSTRKRTSTRRKSSKRRPKARKTGVHRRKRAKTTPKRHNKPKKHSKSMAKGGILGKVRGSGILKKVLIAAGAATVATTVAALVFPRAVPLLSSPAGRAGVGFIFGDFVGAAGNFLLAGGVGNIGSLGGGSSNGNGGNGFA